MYLKELKHIFGIGLLLMGFCIVLFSILYLELYGLITMGKLSPAVVRHVWFGSMYLSLPVVLVYSLNSEFKHDTRYLSLTLPVNRVYFMFAKFIAIVTMSALIFTMGNLAGLLILTIIQRLTDFHSLRIRYPSLEGVWNIRHIIDYIIRQTMIVIHTCAIICAAQGVMETVKRYRALVWFLAFIVCLTIQHWPINRIIIPVFGMEGLAYFRNITALLFLITGHLLYARYSRI